MKVDEAEIAVSTFYLSHCSPDECYLDVIGAKRIDASLFVQEDPNWTFGHPNEGAEGPSHDGAAMPGNCFSFAASAFAPPPPRSGRVLATAHPCPNGADAAALERARKRLIAMIEPYRVPFYDADVARYASPDWWKRQSVRVGQCTDEGAPDPGRHYDDVPCAVK